MSASQETQALRILVASAIVNARGMRRGALPIVNVLDVLPDKLRAEALDDADAVIKALAAAAVPYTVPRSAQGDGTP